VIKGRVLQSVFVFRSSGVWQPHHQSCLRCLRSGITSDPNATAIEATINSTVSFYEATFSNNFTISIGFDEFGGLGASASNTAILPYSFVIAHLQAASSEDAMDTAALACCRSVPRIRPTAPPMS